MTTIEHLLTEHAASLKRFEEAERRYEAVTEEWRRKRSDPVDAEFGAERDRRRVKAGNHCVYFANRTIAYGISALLEIVRGGS